MGKALKCAKDFVFTLRGTRSTSSSPPISPVPAPLGKAWRCNLWLVRLSAAAYGVDMGGYAFEETESRWSLRADVRLNF